MIDKGFQEQYNPDERTGAAVARPAASEWSSGRHPE